MAPVIWINSRRSLTRARAGRYDAEKQCLRNKFVPAPFARCSPVQISQSGFTGGVMKQNAAPAAALPRMRARFCVMQIRTIDVDLCCESWLGIQRGWTNLEGVARQNTALYV